MDPLVLWYGGLLRIKSNRELSCQQVSQPPLGMSYVSDVMTAKRKSLIHAGALKHLSSPGTVRREATVPGGLFLSVPQTRAALLISRKTATPSPLSIGHRWLKDQTASRFLTDQIRTCGTCTDSEVFAEASRISIQCCDLCKQG